VIDPPFDALDSAERVTLVGQTCRVPELPEVEALVGFLTEHAVGRVVARVDLAAISVLKTYDPPPGALHGLEVTGVSRHGKFLALDVSGLFLVTHLARAGWLRWSPALPAAPPRPGKGPLAARVHLDDGSGFDLTEAGTQKRLALYVVHTPADVPGIARLGPDPLAPGFGVEALAGLLAGSRQQVKGLLRDQSVLAGVGNAYSDEVLHAARLSPFRLASSLTEGEVLALHESLQSVLRDAVERASGLAAGELKKEKKTSMRVHGRTGQPCPVCGDTVREVSFADSSLQYCPTCQTGGKPLADRRLSRLLK
jgi:formamidopyrimidine-DNA glycosylase